MASDTSQPIDQLPLPSSKATPKEIEQHYRSLFEATSDGLIITDINGKTVEVNPAFCAMHGYTREELLSLDPRVFIHPGSHHLYTNYMAAILAGRNFQAQAIDVRKDGSLVHVEVHGSPVTYRGTLSAFGVVRDISDRVQAYQLLEQRVADRTRLLTTLLDIARTVTSTLELRPLLNLTLDQLKMVTDFTGATVLALDEDDLVALAFYRTIPTTEESPLPPRFPARRLGPNWDTLLSGRPVIIADVRGNTPEARSFQGAWGDMLDTRLSYVSSSLGVPLVVKDRVIGVLSMSSNRVGAFTERDAELTMAIAHHVAIAIENARLYEQAQEAARRATALARVASQVALGAPLETGLAEVARSVVEASGAVACTLMIREEGPHQTYLMGSYGLPEGYSVALEGLMRAGGMILSDARYYDADPVTMTNVRQGILEDPMYGPLQPFMHQAPWDSIISLPLVSRSRHQGRLNLYYPLDAEPDKAEMDFLTAIASQAAIAVENARLFAEAQGKAALEERQRLARELHDSVSQALYGIVLGTATARTLLERDPTQIGQPLEYVHNLAEAGLAEMRALIFELRPESLASEGLVSAIIKQAAALRARYEIPVLTTLGEEPDLSLNAKEALYRIAQEAMHNVVKHAQASQVKVSLTDTADGVQLVVQDDGIGFDPQGDFPGHLGLKSMRERVLRQNGSFTVESAPNQGTHIRAWLPKSSVSATA